MWPSPPPARRLLAAALLVMLCAGCRMPSERACYRRARQAVEAHPSFPAGAKVQPLREASVQVAKNAARVDLVCRYTTDGRPGAVTYTVWLKRIARRWEIDRCFPAPVFPDAAR